MPRPKFLTPSSFDRLMVGYREDEPDRFDATALAVVRRLAAEMVGYMPEEEKAPTGAREWGIQNEWLALQSYQEKHLVEVRKARFRVSPTLPYVGGTIDGLVGRDGGVEAKCPENTIYHFDRFGQLRKYRNQIHGYMWVYGLAWIDFISFDPRYPKAPEFELIVDRIERDEAHIAKLDARCRAAHNLAQSMAEDIRAKYGRNVPHSPAIPF